MKLVLYIILLLSIVLIVSSKYASKRPRNRRQGVKCYKNCVLLRDCDPFLELLRNQDVKVRRKIRESICGRERHRIKVCCPNKPDIQESFFPYNCGNNPADAGKIYKGKETSMGEFPWIAVLEYKKYGSNRTAVKCAGSLINARYVLTAAHCFDPRKLHGYELYVIRLGDWNLSTKEDCFEGQDKKVCAPPFIAARPEKIISHPTYDKIALNADDIALIRLDRTIDFEKSEGYIMPICIPPFGIEVELLKRNRDPIVIGWGKTEKPTLSPILLKAKVPFADRNKCERIFIGLFGEKQLCIGGGESDSCEGDSGGPLILPGPNGPPFLQIGIVSFGKDCGTPGIPAVYTSVQHYNFWISQNMEPWDK